MLDSRISKFFVILMTVGSMVGTGLANFNLPIFAQLDEPTDTVLTIDAKVTEDHVNVFDENLVSYNVKNFVMNLSNDTDLCPTNDCTFKFTHEQSEGFSKNGITDRTFDGVLKVTSEGKTKIFNMNSNLDVFEEENDADGKITKEILQGTLQFSQGDVDFGNEYQVNGTVTWNNDKNGELSLEGYL